MSQSTPSSGRQAAGLSPSRWFWGTVAVGIATALLLRWWGRSWWCDCGQTDLWIGDPLGAHCSQHLLDPYSLTHVLHGVLLSGILAWAWPRLDPRPAFVLGVILESLWELLENSQFIIDRYRTGTIAQGYVGDSVINSLSDIVCCGAGFLLARRLGWRRSAVLFAATELLLLVWIRDNLTLNVLMLAFPLDAIRQWQSG
ncbi:MAG: DUF2585 family protein [Planctomycetales bacterium]